MTSNTMTARYVLPIILTAVLALSLINTSLSYASNYIVEKRIICLAPNLTEICYSLGLEKNIVAVTDHCEYPKRVKGKPSVGHEKNLDLSKIIQFQPNLIISSARVNNAQQIQQLINRGFSVLITSNDSINEIFGTIKQIGTEMNVDQRAQYVVDFMKNRISQVRSIADEYKMQRILLVVNSDPFITCQRGSIIDQLIRIAGGDNIGGSPEFNTPFPDLEKLLAYTPEVILELTSGDPTDTSAIDSVYTRWSHWGKTPAIQAGRIYVIPASPLLSGSPRLIEGLEMIAAALYPEKSKELLNSDVKQLFE